MIVCSSGSNGSKQHCWTVRTSCWWWPSIANQQVRWRWSSTASAADAAYASPMSTSRRTGTPTLRSSLVGRVLGWTFWSAGEKVTTDTGVLQQPADSDQRCRRDYAMTTSRSDELMSSRSNNCQKPTDPLVKLVSQLLVKYSPSIRKQVHCSHWTDTKRAIYGTQNNTIILLLPFS